MDFAPGIGPLPGCALESWVGLTSLLSDLRPRHSEWCNFCNVQRSGPSHGSKLSLLFHRKICLYGWMRCSLRQESAMGRRTSDPGRPFLIVLPSRIRFLFPTKRRPYLPGVSNVSGSRRMPSFSGFSVLRILFGALYHYPRYSTHSSVS